MSREFKQGERVFSILEGWGSVIEFKKRVMHPENDMREAIVVIRFDKRDHEMLLPEHTFALLQNEEYKLVPNYQENHKPRDFDFDRQFLLGLSNRLASEIFGNRNIDFAALEDRAISTVVTEISIKILEKVDKYLDLQRQTKQNQ